MSWKRSFITISIVSMLLISAVSLALASADTRQINQCPPEECPETTPEPPLSPPPSEDGESSGSGGESSGWSGLTDGRLNPAADEYYSIWCVYDQIEVWRAVPNSQLISAIPLRSVIDGPYPLDGGSGLTVNVTGDTVTISGANGNGPAHPGSKSFSLSECISRNGGEPPPAEPSLEEEPASSRLSGGSSDSITTETTTGESEEPNSEQQLSPFGVIVSWCLPGLASLGFSMIIAPGTLMLRRRQWRKPQNR